MLDTRAGVTDATFQDIWKQLRKAPGSGLPQDIIKAITQNTGLVWYDLEPYAKLLFPVITPLRNEIPRVKGDGGTSTNWKTITAVNTQNVDIGLGEGHRGGSVTTTVNNLTAIYKTFGLDDSVTFEADLAAENFDDAKKLATENLLRATMIGEEKAILGANTDLQLGTTPQPGLTAGSSGSIVGTVTLSVICVALSYDGFNRVGGVNAAPGNSVLIPGAITRINTDGSTDTFGGGSAQKSPNQTVSITSSTGSCVAVVTPVRGAVGYAWFWGNGAGNEILGAITSTAQVTITAYATAGNQAASTLPASDNSTNALIFDGLMTQISTSGSGSYYNQFANGASFTADGGGGIVEIETALKSFWDTSRLGPEVMLVNSQELRSITKITIAQGTTPLFRFYGDMQGKDTAAGMQLTAGVVVGTYLNKYTMGGGQLVQVLLHPNVPPGTLVFYSRKVPYPLANVRNLLQMKMRRDYFQIEWPQTRPMYEYSVWANGVLQNYFNPAFGLITNITAS